MARRDDEVLGSIASSLPVAVFRTGPEGTFLAGNEALVALLGADSFDELAGTPVLDMYVDPALRYDLFRRVLDGQSAPIERVQLRRRDGTRVWVRMRSHVLRDDAGGVRFVDGFMEDISDVADAETKALRERTVLRAITALQDGTVSEPEIATLLEDILQGLMAATGAAHGVITERVGAPDRRVLRSWASSDFLWDARQRRVTLEDGREVLELGDYDQQVNALLDSGMPIVANDIDQAGALDDLRGGQQQEPLVSLLVIPIMHADSAIGSVTLANSPDGFSDWVVDFVQPIAVAAGALMSSARMHREHAVAEQRRDALEGLAASVIERAADFVVGFDDADRIVSANTAAGALLGVPATSIVGTSVRDLVPPGKLDSYRAQTRAAFRENRSMEAVIVLPGGGTKTVEVTFVRARIVGDGVTVMIGRDIAKRKETEAALFAAKDSAERAARAKDDLLAGMSHELRTPLNAVIGLTDVLGREIYGPLTDKQREYVQQIGTSGRHLLAIISDILDVSKLEAEGAEIVPEVALVDNLVDEATRVVRELAQARGLALTVQVPARLPAVFADRRRTVQIILNLLSNAIKFTPEGGEIAVSAFRDGGAVAVRVRDSGIGIPADAYETIFDAFVQLDSSLAKKYPGTGLGLTLTRRLARAQGGDVSVSSMLGEGSAFTVRIPIARISLSHP